jgi:hypothetical protein
MAQEHLKNLGYYEGKVDGIMGRQTREAIRNFQKDQSLKADGVLGPKTNRALAEADHRVIGTHSFIAPNVVMNVDPTTINPSYTNGLNGGTQTVATRFGQVVVKEDGAGSYRHYTISLNGQPVLAAEGQPSVITVSPTYDLGGEDAIVFTTFSPDNQGCIYKSHVLVLNSGGSKVLDIDNCTKNFQARVDNGSLFITFPEHDDNRAFGSTWRLEGTSLERL